MLRWYDIYYDESLLIIIIQIYKVSKSMLICFWKYVVSQFFHSYSSLRNGLFETVHYLLKLNFASDVICYKSLSKYKEASSAVKKRSFLAFFSSQNPRKKYTSNYFWVTEMLFSIFFSWFVLRHASVSSTYPSPVSVC